MGDCLFCKIYERGKETIYENKKFFAQFDKFPISPGHAEVIPRRHVVSLQDLSIEEWAYLQSTITDVMGVIEETPLADLYQSFIQNPLNDKSVAFSRKMLDHPGIDKKPDAYNLGINDGRAAGRTIDHLHLHIIPRFDGDVENPRGGVRNIIPGMGDYTGK